MDQNAEERKEALKALKRIRTQRKAARTATHWVEARAATRLVHIMEKYKDEFEPGDEELTLLRKAVNLRQYLYTKLDQVYDLEESLRGKSPEESAADRKVLENLIEQLIMKSYTLTRIFKEYIESTTHV